jgi:hypothetical protein
LFAFLYSDPVEVLHGIDGPTAAPGATVAPRWTVRRSCADRELLLKARLPEDDLLLIAGDVAQIRLDDLVHGLRRAGMDPRVDKQSIVVEVADTGDTARFDPRQPYPRYPPR